MKMKEIKCGQDREKCTGYVVGAGDFIFHCDFQWAKWPVSMQGIHVLNGCIDRGGNLIVTTDHRDYPLVVFDAGGNYIRTFGKGDFQKAHSVFITPHDTLLVADSSTSMHVIREITWEGEVIRDFGNLGIPGDSGYVTGSLDSIRRLGLPFCRPCSMKMSSSGQYFAADGYGNAAVHKFDKDGTYLTSWGGPGREAGKFRLVHDICIDKKDRIWVADRENACVHIFDENGEILAYISEGLFRIGSIWADEDFVYIGELDGGITIFNLELQIVSRFGYPGSPLHAHGLTGDGKGNLFVFTNKFHQENNIICLVRKK